MIPVATFTLLGPGKWGLRIEEDHVLGLSVGDERKFIVIRRNGSSTIRHARVTWVGMSCGLVMAKAELIGRSARK